MRLLRAVSIHMPERMALHTQVKMEIMKRKM
jgi:hypothetical protein